MIAASYRSPKTDVRPSGTHGRGLYAAKTIRKGEVVSIRGGHILPRRLPPEQRKPRGYWGYPIADGFILCAREAAGCRGVITADDWRRKDLQRKYRGYFSSYLLPELAGS
jgi:hypothetical protein